MRCNPRPPQINGFERAIQRIGEGVRYILVMSVARNVKRKGENLFDGLLRRWRRSLGRLWDRRRGLRIRLDNQSIAHRARIDDLLRRRRGAEDGHECVLDGGYRVVLIHPDLAFLAPPTSRSIRREIDKQTFKLLNMVTSPNRSKTLSTSLRSANVLAEGNILTWTVRFDALELAARSEAAIFKVTM